MSDRSNSDYDEQCKLLMLQCATLVIRQSMSVGHLWLTTGMETCGSELLMIIGLHGSGCCSGCCEYSLQVLGRLRNFYLF